MRKKKSIAIGILAISILGLAGCTNKKESVIVFDEEETTAPKQEETLAVSTQAKFSYADLTVGSIKYLMTEQEVINILGEPNNIYNANEKKEQNTESSEKDTTSESKENVKDDENTQEEQNVHDIDEKVYSYKELTLVFSNIEGQYKLSAAASVGENETFSRGIKVGDNVDKILDQYYREQNCLNEYFYSKDQTTVLGNMLYGDFTIDDLDTVRTDGKIEYGVINYNGYESVETAESYIIEFTYFEPPYISNIATVNDNFAQIAFDIDNSGTITAIRWYFYPRMENN